MTRRVHPKHDVLWLKKNSAAVRLSACSGVALDFYLCLAPWVCSRSRRPVNSSPEARQLAWPPRGTACQVMTPALFVKQVILLIANTTSQRPLRATPPAEIRRRQGRYRFASQLHPNVIPSPEPNLLCICTQLSFMHLSLPSLPLPSAADLHISSPAEN